MAALTVTRWEARIAGDSVDLEYLAHVFSDPPLTIVKQPDGTYRLHHNRFDVFDDAANSGEVFERANEQAAILSGILVYERQSQEPLAVDALYTYHEDTLLGITMQLKGAVIRVMLGAVTFSIVNADGSPAVPPKPARPIQLWNLALTDGVVAKALRLLNAGDMANWSGLYRIYEVIFDDVGGDRNIVGFGWASERQIERFRRSANSPSVSGDSARHAKETTQPPPNPMLPSEAKAFVTGLLDAWLQSKGVF